MGREKALAAHLADFVCGLTIHDLPPGLIQKVKLYFLDWLGSAYAGSFSEPARIGLGLAAAMGGRPQATVLADGSMTTCLLAALVNGFSSHVVEMDDLHREAIFHPAAAVMPAVFAAAQRERASGGGLIEGIVAGYEVGIRVALAAGPGHYRFWHTTATCGTFGAAAGAGKILGLDSLRLSWALGSAGTQASGLWEFLVEGAMSKQLHAGKASMNGLLAALLARDGFTGAVNILEGEKGFFCATSPDFDANRLLRGLGRQFETENNSLKYHASCGHTHSAIDATLMAIQGRGLQPDQIASILVSTYQGALDLLSNVRPGTPYAAKFNLPYCVAAAIKYGRVGLSEFAEDRLRDPEIQGLMPLVEVRSDPGMSAQYPQKWPAGVEISLKGGEKLVGFNEYPKGDPRNPLSEQECVQKFRDLSGNVLGGRAADDLIQQVLNLEEIRDVHQLRLT